MRGYSSAVHRSDCAIETRTETHRATDATIVTDIPGLHCDIPHLPPPTSIALQFDQAALDGCDHRLGAISYLKARENFAEVTLDRDFSEVKSGGNLFVAFPVRQQIQHFPFPFAKVTLGRPIGKYLADLRGQKSLAMVDTT